MKPSGEPAPRADRDLPILGTGSRNPCVGLQGPQFEGHEALAPRARVRSNDEHLVIRLPKGPDAAEANGIFMPFDDTVLGHVLAKAFLLADDAKIRDAAIRRQIQAR